MSSMETALGSFWKFLFFFICYVWKRAWKSQLKWKECWAGDYPGLGFLYNNGIYGFFGYIFLRHLASNALNIAWRCERKELQSEEYVHGEREREGKNEKKRGICRKFHCRLRFGFESFSLFCCCCSCNVADVTGLKADKRYIYSTSMHVYMVDGSTHTALGEARYVVALTRLRFTQRRWQVACCCCCSCTLQRRPRSSQAARPWAHYGFGFGFGSDRIGSHSDRGSCAQ